TSSRGGRSYTSAIPTATPGHCSKCRPGGSRGHRCGAGRSHAAVPGRISTVSVQLNHTIVNCRDQQRSAAFLAGILGLPPATRFGPFLVVAADNDVSLDFRETSGPVTAQHYAFLVGEAEFDETFGRI